MKKKRRRMAAVVIALTILMGDAGFVYASEEPATLTGTEETDIEDVTAAEETEFDEENDSETQKESYQQDVETEVVLKGEQTVQQADTRETEISWDQLYLPETEIYAQLPELMTDYMAQGFTRDGFRVIVEDASICSLEMIFCNENYLTYRFEGKKPGLTRVAIYYGNTIEEMYFIKGYTVRVKEKPADAVDIQDAAMNYALRYAAFADVNLDGYTSRSELNNLTSFQSNALSYPGLRIQDWSLLGEMGSLNNIGIVGYDMENLDFLKEVKNLDEIQIFSYTNGTLKDYSGLSLLPELSSLTISGEDLTDLSVLKYLQNPQKLSWLTVTSNSVTDISALYDMKNLSNVNLPESVSDEARWELADFQDVSLAKGELLILPKIRGIFTDAMEFVPGENADLVLKEDTSYANAYHASAMAPGETTLTVKYHELSKEIKITVGGIPADQETGEEYTEAIETVGEVILDSSGQLWQLYPEVKKAGSNVKKYASGWIYNTSSSRGEKYAYTLDNQDTLWNGEQKLAENVADFDGRYALTKEGTLLNIANEGDEKITDVKDWALVGSSVGILKTDGTFWTRYENPSEEEPEELTLVAEHVVQISDSLEYLKEDGTYWNLAGGKLAENVAELVPELDGDTGYYDRDGIYYLNFFGAYQKTAAFQVKACTWFFDGRLYEVYILTEDGKVYRCLDKTEPELVAENGVQLGIWGAWAYQTADGVYRDGEGQPVEHAPVEAISSILENTPGAGLDYYSLVSSGGGLFTACKNDISVLTNAVHIWEAVGRMFCLRTDGTIWDITEVPQMILDLQNPPEAAYVRGDADGDGEPGISDLRLVLRHVCGKVTLEGTAYEAADVTDDGTVGIDDLRKILRYVCGKIAEL